MRKAYDNWLHVLEYDGKALLNLKQNKKATAANYPVSYDQQISQNNLSVPVPLEQPSVDAGMAVGGKELLKSLNNYFFST